MVSGRLPDGLFPYFGLATDADAAFPCGTRQPLLVTGSFSRLPEVKRLDSRMRVRKPSMRTGTLLRGTPRIAKIISAASPGALALEVIPTP